MTETGTPRCEHRARIPYVVRCELPAGHVGDHAGGTGTRHGWTHRADLPSADYRDEPRP